MCTKPNSCRCMDGFRKKIGDSNWNICYPICDDDFNKNECMNGTCIPPLGHCTCLKNYRFSSETNFTCLIQHSVASDFFEEYLFM